MSRLVAWESFERAVATCITSGQLGELDISAVTVIVNPCAGCFTSGRKAARTIAALSEAVAAQGQSSDSVAKAPSVRFLYTHYVGHACELAQAELGIRREGRLLLVSAGGDGTHGEIMRAMLDTRNESRADAIATRLPLGTGNDGADAANIALAMRMLHGHAQVGLAGHLRVEPTGLRPHYGFNIASIGLDAYIAAVTNRFKRMFAGDLYKLVADVATLFYQQLVGVDPMRLTLTSPDGATEVIDGAFMLTAIGVSGHRVYGGGKKVLPGAENLCAIEPLGLLGKIKLKALFYEGEHIGEPTVTMREAVKVRVDYARRVPMQVDGESVWLAPECFPVIFSVCAPSVAVLQPRS